MQKAALILVALLCIALSAVAQSPAISATVGVRYSAQISNAPAGNCGCFSLQGGAVDASWNLAKLGKKRSAALGLAADFGMERTASVNGAPYGLTLTTFAAGPRITVPVKKLQPFVQALFGVAHGSNTQFPSGNSLIPSASSFDLDLGGAVDYPLNKLASVRLLQLDFERTDLPNITNNWQNSLRVGAGITLRFSR